MNIIEAMSSPQLFGPWFKSPSWATWKTLLRALFALAPTGDDLDTFKALTGRSTWPKAPMKEAWLICGRRSGKSRIMALLGCFLAVFYDYQKFLAPGERGMIAIIAADKDQAHVILQYLQAFFEIPLLAKLVKGKPLVDGLDLKSGVTVRVMTNSMRRLRGYTLVAALADEMASWSAEGSAEPDLETLAAIRPAMLTVPNSMLICGSSPYARRGAIYDTFQRYYGKDDPRVLVVKAPTVAMNPSVDRTVIDEAYQEDPLAAAAEYGAEFRSDVEAFVTREAIAAVTSRGVLERAPLVGSAGYRAFCDPSGGTSDAMTLAIAHLDKDGVAVLDKVYSRVPPFSPEGVVNEIALTLKRYGLSKLEGDHYAGEWAIEAFKKAGVTYTPSARPKRDIYLDVLSMINSGKVDLLDVPQIAREYTQLERRQSRGGREIIDHPLSGHDDVVNAVSGALVAVADKAGAGIVARTAPVSVEKASAAQATGDGHFLVPDNDGGGFSYDPSQYGGSGGGVGVGSL